MVNKEKKLKTVLIKIPWIAAKHAFYACLILFLAALIFGAILFYRNYLLAGRDVSEEFKDNDYLNSDSYNQMKGFWEEEQKRFDEAGRQKYSNPFI